MLEAVREDRVSADGSNRYIMKPETHRCGAHEWAGHLFAIDSDVIAEHAHNSLRVVGGDQASKQH
jgi:hypothetical protein